MISLRVEETRCVRPIEFQADTDAGPVARTCKMLHLKSGRSKEYWAASLLGQCLCQTHAGEGEQYSILAVLRLLKLATMPHSVQ